MSRERWGTFSVIDHKNPATLVPEVLLYDRLVLPVPPNEDERKRWTDRGWAPDVLDRRLEQLGPLAVTASWSHAERQRAIEAWEQHMKTVRSDAEQIVREIKEKAPYQMTRMVLANDKPVVLPLRLDAEPPAERGREADNRARSGKVQRGLRAVSDIDDPGPQTFG